MGLFDRFRKKSPQLVQPADVQSGQAQPDQVKSQAKPLLKKVKDVASGIGKAKQTVVAKQAVSGILLQPIVTEKASLSGAYYFKIKPTTNRQEVAKAFTALYGKTPRKVNIMNVMGKSVRFGRLTGQRNHWKKAVVYLTKGETIDVFSE